MENLTSENSVFYISLIVVAVLAAYLWYRATKFIMKAIFLALLAGAGILFYLHKTGKIDVNQFLELLNK